MKQSFLIILLLCIWSCKKDPPSTASSTRLGDDTIIAPDQFKASKKQRNRESASVAILKVNDLKRKVLDSPSDAKSHKQLSELYGRMGQNKSALKHLRYARSAKGLTQKEKVSLAQLYTEVNQASQAAVIYNGLIKQDPQNWRLRNDIANVYRKEKQYNKALSIIEKILRAQKDNIFAMHTMSHIYADQKNFDMAELILQKARKLNPKNAETWNQIGILYQAKGNHTQAQKAFLVATQKNPQLVEPKLNLAQYYITHHDHNNAVKIYSDILQIEPLQLIAMYHLGVSSAALGLEDEAHNKFSQLLQLAPEHQEGLFAMGILNHYNMQDGQKALKYYRKYIALNPGLSSKHEVFNHMKRAEKMPPKIKPGTDNPSNGANKE